MFSPARHSGVAGCLGFKVGFFLHRWEEKLGFKPAASNPDTLPPPIIRALNMAGGRKQHDQGDQTSAGAYLATYRQTVITYVANGEI